MAPRASTSRAQRSPSASSDDAARRRQRNHKQANGRRHASDDDSEGDNAAQIAALDLKEPLKTCRHLFLQALIARKTLSLDTAKALYKECVKLCSRASLSLTLSLSPARNQLAGADSPLPPSPSSPNLRFRARSRRAAAARELHRPARAGFVAVRLRHQGDEGSRDRHGHVHPRASSALPASASLLHGKLTPASPLSQVNTIQDEPAKLATEYKAEEIAFFKAIVRPLSSFLL